MIACLAAPAVAMPMAQPDRPTIAAGHCDDQPRRDAPDTPRAALHGCIGCVAPIAVTPAPPEPVAIAPAPYRQAYRSLTPNPRDGPDTPPPRSA